MTQKVNAKFSVVLKDGKPWLKWDQYEVTYLRIWKAKSNSPYCKYNGLTVALDDYLIKELKEVLEGK